MKTDPDSKFGYKIRGVNLGSWLLLEKWMVPSLFEGLAARDETAWCVELGSRAESLLKHHWNTFITGDDFAWLAGIGINAVRIPVGHWLFGPDYPYHSAYGDSRYPYVEGGLEILDRAFDWAEQFGLHVMLDLHAAPGCQNGFDNGGIQDVCEWHTDATYIDYSVSVLGRLAERYRNRPSLYGIEVLNEPRWDIDSELLKGYTIDGYRRIRQFCRAEDVTVVFHDGFRSFREYLAFMQPPEFSNVMFDIHRYQCFVREDHESDIYRHLEKTAVEWKQEADAINSELRLPTLVGEWSLGLNLRVPSLWTESPLPYDADYMDDFQTRVAYRAYASAQLMTFEQYRGWFFWSYKTETMPHWCFRDCVEQGWLPDRFQ